MYSTEETLDHTTSFMLPTDAGEDKQLGETKDVDLRGQEGGRTDNEHRPPDGEWGWVVVGASFMSGVIAGVLYGGFSLLYVDISDYYNIGQGKTGWVGSIFTASSTFPVMIVSVFVNQYGCRTVCCVGSALATLGFVISWLANHLPLLIIGYGILSGTGYGIITYTSTIIVQQYFDSKRPFAAGVANSGLSLGTIITGPVVVYLSEAYGWRGAMLILAGMALNVCVFAAAFRPLNTISSKPPPSDKDTNIPSTSSLRKRFGFLREVFDFHLLKQASLSLFIVTLFCMTLAIVPVFQHVPSRAYYLDISPHHIAVLPTVVGVSNFVAKVGCSFIGNLPRVNRLMQYSLALLLAGAVTMCVQLAFNFPAFALYCAVMGIFNGCAVALRPTIVVDLVGIEALPRANAFIAVSGGIASLVGTPMAGLVFDATDNYDIPFYILGGIQVFGGLLSIVNACLIVRRPTKSTRQETAEDDDL